MEKSSEVLCALFNFLPQALFAFMEFAALNSLEVHWREPLLQGCSQCHIVGVLQGRADPVKVRSWSPEPWGKVD